MQRYLKNASEIEVYFNIKMNGILGVKRVDREGEIHFSVSPDNAMTLNKQDIKQWYPMRVTYSREMKIKALLDEAGIDSFIPMHYVEKTIKDKTTRNYEPVIHNLIFIYESRSCIDNLKSISLRELRYIMDRENHSPIIIPTKQMDDFIAVAATDDEQTMYLDAQDVALKRGDRVRILSGIWKGVEGKFVRIKRGLRVVVEIQGIMAIATASLHPSLVEKIDV